MRHKTVTEVREQSVSKNYTERIKKSDRYYTKPKTLQGKDFFIFKEYGDYLKGKLLSRHSNHHINRTCSFQIEVYEMKQGGIDVEVEPGRIEEFFANRFLQKIIHQNELVGSIIRIVYIGRLKSDFGGHSAKIYEVYKITGFIHESEVRKNGKVRKRTGGKKAGRKIRAGTAAR